MPLVSKSEAARLVGVTRQTIHRKIKAGELSATGSEVDTSELIRVFGAISDGTQPVTPMSQPDSAVQTTLQARVDGLESQLAVTREQLADTSKDRDEWREVAKEATSNVKLITNQGSAPKSNDNMMIFVAVAFVVGIGVAYMMLRNDVTPSDAMPLPAPVETQAAEPTPYPEGMINNYGQPCREDNPYSQDAGCPESVNYGWVKVIDQTGNITKEWGRYAEHDPWIEPELQADVTTENVIDRLDLGGGRVTDPEIINRLNRLRAEKKAAEQGADVTGSVTPN